MALSSHSPFVLKIRKNDLRGTHMKLFDLLQSISYTADTKINLYQEIDFVTSRSGDVKTNSLFVCLRGTHQNGKDYIKEAISHGAVAILGDTPPPDPIDVPFLRCENPRRALAFLCDTLYGHPTKNIRVIGVTGTNGKSSTASFLFHILQSSGKRVGLCSTVEDRVNETHLGSSGMTTQDPEELYPKLRKMADCGIDYLILEVSSHALALDKVAPISFHGALLTNLSPEHLDFHRTMEEYARAKSKLLASANYAILPSSIAQEEIFLPSLPQAHYTYSCSDKNADFFAFEPQTTANGIQYHFLFSDLIFRIKIPLFGNFTYDNSLLAAACAHLEGISKEEIQQALSTLPAVKGRLEPVLFSPCAPFRVFLDYAHTPDALHRVLTSLRSIQKATDKEKKGRICLLFGCGGDRDTTKRSPMGKIAAELADFIIVTEDNNRSEVPEEIFTEILQEIPRRTPHLLIRHRRDAIHHLLRQAKEHDILLLAGKGHETYEIQKEGKLPFDERQILEEAYQIYFSEK